jgi:hypothetical protein
LGFIRDGRHESQTITKHKVQKIINKKPQEVLEEIKSDELILDIDLDVLLALIKNYNKGTQLWMVKTQANVKKESTKSEDSIKEDSEFQKEVSAKIMQYPYRMYEPKKIVHSQKGVITYANDKEGKKTKSQTTNIVQDKSYLCQKENSMFIVGVSRSFYLREEPSLKAKAVSVLQKNTIIPYTKKEGSWYQTCDENFIHETVVKPILKEIIKEKLGQYE